jgi:hypothetical protein
MTDTDTTTTRATIAARLARELRSAGRMWLYARAVDAYITLGPLDRAWFESAVDLFDAVQESIDTGATA